MPTRESQCKALPQKAVRECSGNRWPSQIERRIFRTSAELLAPGYELPAPGYTDHSTHV